MLKQLQRHRGTAQITGNIESTNVQNVVTLSDGNPGAMFAVAAGIANADKNEDDDTLDPVDEYRTVRFLCLSQKHRLTMPFPGS